MILLLLLIISSAFIELLQSMIPISQMLTAAFLAIGVAFFIGWEEKITAWFVTTDSDGDSSSIIGDESISTLFGKFTMMMSITLIYIIVFCCLFTSMGVGA
jgi:O-antigen ligase